MVPISQFAFLADESPALFDPAKKAELAALSDPRSACFHARLTLEVALLWMFRSDKALKPPYQDTLAALVHEPSLAALTGPSLIVRFMCSTWPLVQGFLTLVSRCSIACLRRTLSKMRRDIGSSWQTYPILTDAASPKVTWQPGWGKILTARHETRCEHPLLSPASKNLTDPSCNPPQSLRDRSKLDRSPRLDWGVRDRNDERSQWSFQATIPFTASLDRGARHLASPKDIAMPDHVVGLAGEIVIADRRPHRGLSAFHRKAVFGADKWRRNLFAASASVVVQGDPAFLGYIEDPVFKYLRNFIYEDGAKPIDPGHHKTLFAM